MTNCDIKESIKSFDKKSSIMTQRHASIDSSQNTKYLIQAYGPNTHFTAKLELLKQQLNAKKKIQSQKMEE